MKKSIFTLILGIFFFNAALAQLSERAAWAVDAYVEYGFIEPNITYVTVDNMPLKLDVYRPKTKPAKLHPTLVFFHGGGWRGGSKESYSLRVLPWLEMGWTVVNVEYRLTGAGIAPAAVEDCRCAIRWVIDNAEKYDIDKNKIVLSGQSAGGHLALMTGMATNEPVFDKNCPAESEIRVAAIVNWFGITDVADILDGQNKTEFANKWIGREGAERLEMARKTSPLTYVRAGLPPIITIHGDADPLVPYSHARRLKEALDKERVPNELVTIPKGDHGDFSREESIRAYAEIRRFLKKHGIE